MWPVVQQARRLTGQEADRHGGRQARRLTGMEADRRGGRQAWRPTGMEDDRHGGLRPKLKAVMRKTHETNSQNRQTMSTDETGR